MLSIDQEGYAPSPVLQALVELLATVELVSQSLSPSPTSSKNAQNLPRIESGSIDDEDIDLRCLNFNELVVEDAVYGVLDSDDPALTRSVTNEIRAIVRSLGASMLLLASSLSHVKCFDVEHEHEPLKSVTQDKKALRVRFAVESTSWIDGVGLRRRKSKEFSRQFDQERSAPLRGHRGGHLGLRAGQQKASIVRASPSWFDRIVSLSKQTLNGAHTHCLPDDIVVEGFVVNSFAKSFLPILSGSMTLKDEHEANGATMNGSIDPVGSFSQFSACFWLYIDSIEGPVSSRSGPLFHKGSRSSSLYPAIRLSSGVINVFLHTQFGRVSLVAPEAISESNWTHICVTCDGVAACLIIDGEEKARSQLLAVPAANSDPIFVGAPPPNVIVSSEEALVPGLSSDSSSVSFEGAVDIAQVRYYFKYLETVQVADIVAKYQPPDVKERKWPDVPSPPIVCKTSDLQRVVQNARRLDWNCDMDQAVMDLVQRVHELWLRKRGHGSQHVKLMTAQPHCVPRETVQRLLSEVVVLANISVDEVIERFFCIRALNQRVHAVLKVPIIDFSQAADAWSLASRLSSLRDLVFTEVKLRPWERVLRETETGGLQHIVINRPRALKAKTKGDPEGCKSVFGQIYRQLHFLRPSVLRCRNRPWSVTYAGEGGQDAGMS